MVATADVASVLNLMHVVHLLIRKRATESSTYDSEDTIGHLCIFFTYQVVVSGKFLGQKEFMLQEFVLILRVCVVELQV